MIEEVCDSFLGIAVTFTFSIPVKWTSMSRSRALFLNSLMIPHSRL